MTLATEISLTADQLDIIVQGLQSIKGYEVKDAASLLRLWDRMVKERDRLHLNSQGMKIQVNVCTQSKGFVEFDDLSDLETFVKHRDDDCFTWTSPQEVSMEVLVVDHDGKKYLFKSPEQALNFMKN